MRRPLRLILKEEGLYMSLIEESIGKAVAMTNYPVDSISSDWSLQRLALFGSTLKEQESHLNEWLLRRVEARQRGKNRAWYVNAAYDAPRKNIQFV